MDAQLLPSPSTFNTADKRWVWHFEEREEDEDGNPGEVTGSSDLPFELDATVRVRVTAVQYSDAAGAAEAVRGQLLQVAARVILAW